MKRAVYLVVALIALNLSCSTPETDISKYKALNDSLRLAYAPDKRVARFHIDLENINGELVLKGETDQTKALNILEETLNADGVQFKNEIDILPNSSIGLYSFAVANNSAVNLRGGGKHAAELVTQVILGTELIVLKKTNSWTFVQTPEKYLAWVDNGGVELMNEGEFNSWKASEKIIYTLVTGSIYQDEQYTLILSDIVLGSKLQLLEITNDGYSVAMPDGRKGYVKGTEAMVYNKWIQEVIPSKGLVESYAKSLLGRPYLWGGTSSKGIDCSGFTKTVYLMNGYIIPRDASQQINAGQEVDKELKFEGLEKGDLMFFGYKASEGKKQRVTHVGIWLGNDHMEFIHSSERVRLNSMDPNSPIYDEGNAKRYLGSRRYLGVEDAKIIDLKKDQLKTSIKL